MSRGLFIALEGLDGVGKSTVATALAASLSAELLGMPGIPRPVAHGVFTALGPDPTARCVFHAACARALGLRAVDLVGQGRSVVLDRYWLSSLAYARARGVGLDVAALEAVIPAPDLTVVLTLGESERHRRLVERGPTEVDRETMFSGFAERVGAEMRAARGPFAPTHWLDVSGLGSAAAHAAVYSLVNGSLVGGR